ncbi:MAG TPA: aquaporin [Ktedonobacterales bacterium]|jgi:glycerol uptake facilitator protein
MPSSRDKDKDASKSSRDEASKRNKQPTQPERSITPAQRLAGEFLGATLLVLFHAGIAASSRVVQAASGQPKTTSGILFIALAQGLSLFAIIMVVGRVSGALLNPAVTLALASCRRLKLADVLPYLGAQFAGAILAALAIVALLGRSAGTIGRVGALSPAPVVPLWQATAVEATATFLLLLVISATAEDPRAPSGWAPLAIGMALATSVALFEPITGAGMNPARAFGPDLIYATLFGGNVNWLDYLVAYALGPILGGIAAVWLYRVLAHQPESKPKPS